MERFEKDLSEIKNDVKEIRGMLSSTLVKTAVLEEKHAHLSGKINYILTIVVSILTGLTAATWKSLKSHLGL
jgi:hypothetical protein